MSDRQLIEDLLSALEYHTEQTRPIEFSKVAIEAAREHLRKPAQQEPNWKAEYLKSVESGCITLDELREANAELDATNRQVEILSDALAESRREIDAMIALVRADERAEAAIKLEQRVREAYQDGHSAGVTSEREACARVCDRMAQRTQDIRSAALESAAENIRARNEK